MAQWKLLVVSGSDARLRKVNALNFTGSLGWSNLIGKPTLVSGSSQISYTGITNKPAGLVSQSANVILGTIKNVSTVAGSHMTGSFTGSFAGDGSQLTGLSAGAVTSYTNTGDNRLITSVNASTINGEANLLFDGTNLSLTGNAHISGRLTVVGTASFQHVNSIAVADRFVLLNSGSIGGDGGIVIYSGSNVGYAFGWDAAATRFAFQQNNKFNATSSAMTPDAYVAAVVNVDGGQLDVAMYQKVGNIKISGSAAWIYV